MGCVFLGLHKGCGANLPHYSVSSQVDDETQIDDARALGRDSAKAEWDKLVKKEIELEEGFDKSFKEKYKLK